MAPRHFYTCLALNHLNPACRCSQDAAEEKWEKGVLQRLAEEEVQTNKDEVSGSWTYLSQ